MKTNQDGKVWRINDDIDLLDTSKKENDIMTGLKSHE